MTQFPQKYDLLYVVSDLHMGGERDSQKNFQIFKHGKRLGNFINYISTQKPDGDVALVLNGDIIDSLAEPSLQGYVALNQNTAVQMMERIYKDESFSPVWSALAIFSQTARRHLVFIVGNHDIELSLPVVQNSILRHLVKDNLEAKARISFSTQGGGFACQVGKSRVFCTHGNEVDDWNWVSYDKLGQLANAMNAGRSVPNSEWKPNAGTRLVVDVMNVVKERYPFVDLLKPEFAAVASVLLALDKATFKKIDLSDAFPVLRDKVAKTLFSKKLLSSETADLSTVSTEAVAEEIAHQLLGPSMRDGIAKKRKSDIDQSVDALLLEAGIAVAEEKRASDGVVGEGEDEILGGWDLVAGWVGLVSREEGLRRALQDWLKDDKTFDVREKDDLYKQMFDRVAEDVDFVITGHTHLARALPIGFGRYYYNSGTWIRLLRLTAEAISNEKVFEEKVWPKLTTSRLGDLDEAMIPGPDNQEVLLLFDRTNAVRIEDKGTMVEGALLRVMDGPNEESVTLELEPNTQPFLR